MDALLSVINHDRSLYRYLLLDPLVPMGNLSPIHIDTLTEMFGQNRVMPVLRPEIAYDPLSCPQLILISHPSQDVDIDLLRNSLNWARKESTYTKRYVCSWITSKVQLQTLSERLVEIGLLMGRTMGLPFVPYFEPFRMQLLQEGNSICPEWLISALKDIETYSYFSTTSGLKTIRQTDYSLLDMEVFITEEAKLYQREARKILHLFLAWHELCEQRGIPLTECRLIDVAEIYKAGRNMGLLNTEDNFVFSLNSLQYGNLLNSPELSAEIVSVLKDEGSLAERFSQLDERIFLSLDRR
ncbi:hypothetical protein LPW36_16060 [Jinshanibacter sp. LJY008]|uniref:DUF4123 domain-containing protein n=1 Tax=Limnobaculum eriocheiris TaxID=2897391 RepID=A0A9X1SM34_9GAMM|nr:hypothetical protein [Limnobaculum eriocheiris]MCD1127490.1 hypothetical protein [Limnobaculum eriocheiris]